MNRIKAFSIVSSDFVSPLFPKKGEEVKLSVAFSEAPDSVFLKYDTDTGLVFMKEMEREKDDLLRYVNLFGYNPKYGIEGKPIGSVTYKAQPYDPAKPLYEIN